MTGKMVVVVLLALCVLAVALPPVQAHQTKIVGGKYKVIVGLVKEPPFTNERNGLDLTVLLSESNAPVENLERSVSAVLISPDGKTARPLKLRPQFGKPGYYTDDFILTRPGVYKIRIFGIIADASFDEIYESHDVESIETLRFP